MAQGQGSPPFHYWWTAKNRKWPTTTIHPGRRESAERTLTGASDLRDLHVTIPLRRRDPFPGWPSCETCHGFGLLGPGISAVQVAEMRAGRGISPDP